MHIFHQNRKNEIHKSYYLWKKALGNQDPKGIFLVKVQILKFFKLVQVLLEKICQDIC